MIYSKKCTPTCMHTCSVVPSIAHLPTNPPRRPISYGQQTPMYPTGRPFPALRCSSQHTHEARRGCASLHHRGVSLQDFDFEAAKPRQLLQVRPGVRIRAVRLQRVSSRKPRDLGTRGDTTRGLVRIRHINQPSQECTINIIRYSTTVIDVTGLSNFHVTCEMTTAE